MKTLTITDSAADELRRVVAVRPELDEVLQQLTARRETLSWLGLPWIEVDIEVQIVADRVLVTKQTLQLMAYSIRAAGIGSPDEDAAYADEILATPELIERAGFFDITSFEALSDQLLELGIDAQQTPELASSTLAVRYCTPETCNDPRCSNYRGQKTARDAKRDAERMETER